MIDVVAFGRRETLAGAEACLATVARAEADQLCLAAHWADLHDPASLPVLRAGSELEVRRRRFAGEYGVQPGGEGTPEVLACCFAELGVVLQSGAAGARHLIGDALDLRHRLPRLWAEVQQGEVRAWKARKVAQATRHLPRGVVDDVDAGLAGLVGALPWSRFSTVLDATLMRADPVGAAHAEEEAASRRFVSLGRDDPQGGRGLKTLIARGEVLDILTFLAAVNRVADLLGTEGDPDPLPVRRSKAVGILGQPDRALDLLSRHQDDPDRPPAPVEPRSAGAAEGGRRAGRPWRRHPSAEDDPSPVEPVASGEPEPECARGRTFEGACRGPRAENVPPNDRAPDEPDEPDEADEPGRRSLDLSPPGGADGSGVGSVASVRVQLYVHLTDTALTGSTSTSTTSTSTTSTSTTETSTDPAAVCRVEGVGPVTVSTVREWLRRADARVTVRPVAVPGNAVPVDAYEIPHATREAVLLRSPASVFPWSWCTDRTALQLDHVQPYRDRVRGGPPGQTSTDNLAPLVGSEHQHKTFRAWQERSPAPGVQLWRSPHGWVHLVTNQGTFPLGHDTVAQRLWHAAAPVEAAQREVAA